MSVLDLADRRQRDHWIGKATTLRPEIRWDRARDVDAYDNPTATPGAGQRSQTMFAMDAIIRF